VSPQKRSKIQSIALIASVAILSMIFGIVLDGKVIPENNKPLAMEEVVVNEEHQERHADQIKELDNKVKETTKKAEELTKRADQLISKTDIPKSTIKKQATPEGDSTSERLADLRGRLNEVKK
jgi:peptidoglycan hydrolase CwlO-like protein